MHAHCAFFVITVSHFFLIFLSLLYQYCLQWFSLESDESGSALLMSYCFNTCSVCVIMDACFFAQETECNEQWKKKRLLCYKFFKQEDHVLVQPSVLVIVAGFFCCENMRIQMASGKMGKPAQARPSQGCVTVLIAALVYRLCEMWRDDKTFHLGLRLWLEHKSVSHSESPALAPSEALCGDIEWLEPLVCGGCVLLAELVHVFSGLQLILMLEFGCAH